MKNCFQILKINTSSPLDLRVYLSERRTACGEDSASNNRKIADKFRDRPTQNILFHRIIPCFQSKTSQLLK